MVDRANLARDTRVYVHALARLLCDDVLAVDVAAQAADLRTALDEIALPKESNVGLAELVEEVAALEKECGRLQQAIAAASSGHAAECDRILMRLSRCLVPLDYTDGNRFTQGMALPQPKWPVLEPLRRLARTASISPRQRRSRRRTWSAIRYVRHSRSPTRGRHAGRFIERLTVLE